MFRLAIVVSAIIILGWLALVLPAQVKDNPAKTETTTSSFQWSSVYLDHDMKVLATCGQDSNQKLIDCKIAEGRTLTELLQVIDDAQSKQYHTEEDRYDRLYSLCKSALDDALYHSRKIEKILKGK